MKKTVRYQDKEVPDEFKQLASEVSKPKMMNSGADLFQNIDGSNTQKLQMVQLQFAKEVNQLWEEI